MAELGKAYIDVHADTSRLGPEIEEGTRKAATEAEASDAFDGFVKAADKAGTRAGDEFGKSFIRDANGRLRDEKGRFVKEAEAAGKEAGDKMGEELGNNLEKKTNSKISGLGKLLAPAWIRTIGAWIAAIAPAAVQLVGTLAPSVGILAAIVPAAIGGAAALTILKFSFGGLSNIVKESTTNVAQFNKDLAQLGPSTQLFVKTLVALKPVFASFKKEVQNSFFAGFTNTATFSKLKGALDNLGFSFNALAYTLGNTFAQALGKAIGPKGLGEINQILLSFNDTLAAFGPHLANLIGAFLRLGTVAAPLLDHLSGSFGKVLDKFATFIDKSAASGQLNDFFEKAGGAFSQLISLASDLSSVIFDIFSAGAKAGGGGGILTFFHLLAKTFDDLNKNGTLTNFFKAYNEIATSLFKVLTPLLPVVGKLAAVLGGAFVKLLQAVTPSLVSIAQSLADALIPVLPALSSALESLAPVLAILAENLADLFKQITPDLSNLLLDLFTGLTQTLIDLIPSLNVILPALSELTVVLVKLLTAQTISYLQAFIVLLPLLADAFLIMVSPLLLFTKLLQGVVWLLDHYVTPFLQGFPAAINQLGPMLGKGFTEIGKWFAKIGSDIADFFTKKIPHYWDQFVGWLESLPDKLTELLRKAFKTAFNAALVEVGVLIGLVVAAFTKLPGKVIGTLSGWGDRLATFLGQEWDKGVKKASEFVANVITYVKGLPDRILGALSTLNTVVGNIFSNAFEAAKKKVTDQIDKIWNYIKGLPGRIISLGGKLLDAGVHLVTQLLNGLAHPGKIINSISDTIFGFLKGKLNYVIGKINDGINAVGKYVGGLPNIPKLARGAFITHPTLAVLGEKNPEVVLPTDDPTRAKQLLDESGLSRSLDFHASTPAVLVTVMIGDQELTQIVDTRVAVANDNTSRQITYGARAI